MDDRWSQMHSSASTRDSTRKKLLKVDRNTIKKTIEHSSTAPYLYRVDNETLDSIGVEQFQEDDYNFCKWHPYEHKLHKAGFSKRQKKQLKFYGWWNTEKDQLVDVWYKTNKQGFRDEHFNDEPGIACFGCSNTYGSGIHAHQNWPAQLAELTGEKTYNLGTPAVSLALAVWYALNFLDEDLPNLTGIAVLVPPLGRAPAATANEDFYNVGTMRAELLENISPDATLDTATINKYADIVNSTSQMTYDMQLKTLQLIAKARNIPLAITYLHEIAPSDWARDFIHPGPQTHTDIAKLTMQKLGKY